MEGDADDPGRQTPRSAGAAPRLAGTGRIGSAVRLLGAGQALPAKPALQWCRDGVAIPGATGAAYVPGAEDDGSLLTCRVALPGGGTAVTPPLPVTREPPALAVEPFEEIFDQGSGPQAVAAAPWFTGEALRFAAAGAGAGIDPATGVLSIPTEVPLADRVTVTARNSGGSAAASFLVTVEGEEIELPPLAAEEWQVFATRDPAQPGAPLVETIRILAGPALAATRLLRAGRGEVRVAAAGPSAATSPDFRPCTKHPEFDDPESGLFRCWIVPGEALAPGERRSTTLRYALDDPAEPLEEAVFSPDGDTRLWLAEAPGPAHAPAAAGGWSVLPMLGKAEYEAFVNEGVLSGDAGQYMLGAAQSESDPDRIYTCQDSGGVWVSLDHGASWNNLLGSGLFARFTTGIAVDPLDSRRVFLLTQGGGTGAGDHIGLQRSLDGGLTWERVIPNDESPGRVIQGPIGFAPTSKDAGLGYATRWYCIVQRQSARNPGDRPHRFFLSDDGGATWRLVRELEPRIYGSITHLAVSPVDPEAAYVYSRNGLWRLEAASDPKGEVTRLSGANGLPEGGVRDRIHLGPDGRTLIVGVGDRGVYRSEDAGASWTLVHADPEIGKLHVNPWDPQRMIISYFGKRRQLKVSTDGGASFREPDGVDTGPGRDGGEGIISELSCLVVWHPKKPDRIWAHGGPMHWQSDDGGRNWRPSNGYFNGKQHQNWFIDQMFDPADPGRFGYFMTDFGVAMTRNGGLWFERGRMRTRALGLKHSSVNGGAIHPDPAQGIVLASVGRMNSGKLVISRDHGASWSVASEGDRRRQYVGFDLDDPSYAYQWRERSTDHGVTWSEMKSLPKGFAVSGMTLTARGMEQGQAIFAIDRDGGRDPDPDEDDADLEDDADPDAGAVAGGRRPGRGGRGGGSRAGNSRILRSLDRVESWQPFVQSPYDFGIAGMTGGGPCRAHPSDPDVFFTRGPNDWTIRRWSPGGSPAWVDLNVMGGFPGGRPPDGKFVAMSLAIDRRHPEVMYVMNAWDGVPNKLFRTVDGGLSWENLSEGFPSTFVRGLEVCPTTGYLFTGSPNGSRVLPPPYRAAAAARSVAAAGVWGQRYLDRPY
jgi:hypothetical protein